VALWAENGNWTPNNGLSGPMRLVSHQSKARRRFSAGDKQLPEMPHLPASFRALSPSATAAARAPSGTQRALPLFYGRRAPLASALVCSSASAPSPGGRGAPSPTAASPSSGNLSHFRVPPVSCLVAAREALAFLGP
jgi:hypothetical protein